MINLRESGKRLLEQAAPSQRETLSKEIEAIEAAMSGKQQAVLHIPLQQKNDFEPFSDFSYTGNIQDHLQGCKLIAEGRVACLLIAGGQGTRLGLDGPKGLCPVSVIKRKTLFQLFAEKTVAAGIQAGRLLQIAIMTSPLNHQATVDFFTAHRFFGLQPSQLAFFMQPTLPFLDADGHMLLQNGHIAQGPDGNGSSLAAFYQAGLWHKWFEAGIRYVNYVLIDNPLANPFDSELAGFHYKTKADVTIKAIERVDPSEKVGVIVKNTSKIQVVEYTEIPEKERMAIQNGRLKHPCANISLFCLNMDFIQRCAELPMPLHAAIKPLNNSPHAPKVTKFETFIFDILPSAEKVAVLVFPREACFAPLKNAEGKDSLTTVRQALQERDKHVFKNISGKDAPSTPFELSQSFYYPTPAFLQKWRNTSWQGGAYIE